MGGVENITPPSPRAPPSGHCGHCGHPRGGDWYAWTVCPVCANYYNAAHTSEDLDAYGRILKPGT
jgi:hypothetical protein